ncbi:coactosin-like protein [Babylonia areolata]|uniref:coactosin-like protein n=1 Tax=Babylonia areolata TaxID=304850 RepID=UPI003FD07BAA
MTTIDKDTICEAYLEVRDDNSPSNWLLCKYDGSNIVLASKGENYEDLPELLGDDETAFVYARIITGDELSKRAKFVFISWAGQNLGILQRAKMSVDRSLVKSITQNFAVEMAAGSQEEVCLEEVKTVLAKAGGADYGTGERD